MNHTILHKKNEKKDRQKSAIITLLMVVLAFIFIYFYQFKKEIPKEEAITTMFINFGDEKNGEQIDEVANQSPTEILEEKQPEPIVEPKSEAQKEQPKISEPKETEKILAGKNENITTKKVEKPSKTEKLEKKETEKTANKPKEISKKEEKKLEKSETKTEKKSNTTNNNVKKSEPSTPKPNEAVGNLIRGRGNKNATQGTDSGSNNAGDPLGGDANGDSKIGVDRKLVAFIPGTMGRGGVQPTHSCTASGTITISFIVDKAGNVTSARRLGGLSDACVVSTTISWVKKYVKAEKSTTSSTGTYSITF